MNTRVIRTGGEEREALATRLELAVMLRVSLRTVDRMLAAGEIVPVRMRGWSVRFYVPDVVECLRRGDRKWGRKAAISSQSSVVGGQSTERTRGA